MTCFPEIDDFLCRILRGEEAAWPTGFDKAYTGAFLRRSQHHGVEALVFDRVRNTPEWGGWPEKARERLTHAMRTGVAFDLLRSYEITRFLEELTRRDLAFLVIKGEALARTHYASPALRSRCDTDLFIDLKDIGNVQTVLREADYEVVPPIYKSHQFTGVSQHHTQASVVFDVHWRILNAPQFARVIRFTEAQQHSASLPGLEGCRTLGPVDALLLACMHRKGSELHDEDRLIWLYDIHLLVSAMTPELLRVFRHKAVEKNVQAACLDGLQQAKMCFHTEIPAETLVQLAAAKYPATLSRHFHDSTLSLLLDDLTCLPDMGSRFSLLRELFLPSPDSLMRKYGRQNRCWLPWLYLRQLLGGMIKRLSLR